MWNWQQDKWPQFAYGKDILANYEAKFLHQVGIMFGAKKHLTQEEQNILIIDALSFEALSTSEIEGEYLDRDSLQSSIKRHFGININAKGVSPAELGISEMMIDLYDTWHKPLDHEILFRWHRMLTNGRKDLVNIGEYRAFSEPMQIVSGRDYDPKIHFEAPPSDRLFQEMERYVKWYNNSQADFSALERASIAHLYFESIHPFEDGNGRIGRALVIKALSQSLNQPILIALSTIINKNKKDYYASLEQNNRGLGISKWLIYFAKTLLSSQEYSLSIIDFLINKAKFYDKYKAVLNERQAKVVERIFAEGAEGFVGHLSAEKYIRITKTSKATATRDLQELVGIGAMIKTGQLKGTRYHLVV